MVSYRFQVNYSISITKKLCKVQIICFLLSQKKKKNIIKYQSLKSEMKDFINYKIRNYLWYIVNVII